MEEHSAHRNTFPLSWSQRNIWNVEKSFLGTSINNICATIHIKGTLDIALLQRALNLVVQKDSSLRAELVQEGEEIRQYYAPAKEQVFPVFDFSMNSSGIEHWQEAVTREVMPLFHAPLFYFAIFKLGESDGGVLVKTHHMISDGWSQVLLSNRIAQTYLALLARSEPELEEAPSYQLHVQKEQEYLSSKTHDRDTAYWRERLAELEGPSSIKECKSAAVSPVGRRKTFRLSRTLNHAIAAFCEQYRVSAFAVFYMALAIYLQRAAGTDKLGIGVPVFNRLNFTDKQTTGMFVSTLPFVSQIDENWSFCEFNEHLAEQWYELLRYQKLPFPQILEQARKTHPEISHLFHIVLSYQTSKIFENKDTSVLFSGRWNYSGYQAEQLLIHLSSLESEHSYSVDYDYLTQLFSEREIEDVHHYLVNILFEALAHPEHPLWRIGMLGQEEKEKVLFTFNDTYQPLYATSVGEELLESAAQHPARVAAISKGQRMTYEALLGRAEAYAEAIRERGVESGRVVAVLLPKGFDLLCAQAGVVLSGNAFLMLSPDLPSGRLLEILEDSGAAVLLTDSARIQRYNLAAAQVAWIDAAAIGAARGAPRALPNDTDLAYLVYTSGSTGKPKGVEIGQKNLLNFAQAMRGLYGHGAVLSLCNIGFDVFIMESIVALINGRTIVLPTEEEQEDPEKLAALITGYAVGNFAVTPSRLEALLKNRRFASALSGVESIICGGEHFPGELIPALRRHTGARIYNQYGPSETTVGVSYRLVNDAMLLTIGRPMENCRMYILDSHLMPLPIGAYGELYLGGLCVGRGYHNKNALTEERFLPSPFEMGERLYKTGDIGCWTPEGEILLGGRKDDQIKLRGLRIEPQEIASRLALHPEIEQAAVKTLHQEGRMLLAAYYTANREIPETELFEFALSYLPSYMLPTSIRRMEALPLTANGKVDYAALPDPILQTGSGEAETALQEDVLEILRRVLKKPEMGVDDDYFLCGGDSLNGMEAIALLEQKLSASLYIADFYACRTARRLCQKLGEAPKNAEQAEILSAPEADFYPLSPTQMSLYFESQMNPEGLSYNMPGAFYLPEGTSISRLEEAFTEVVSRETVLRTGFVFGPEGLCQKVFPPARFALAALEAENFDQAKAQFVRPFQLERPPLLRAAVWRDEAGRDLLFVDIHHIICDGISTPLLMRRVDEAYEKGILPEGGIQYKDYSYYLQKRGEEDAAEKYWAAQLSAPPEPLELPTDRPRQKAFDYAGAKLHFALGEQQSEACERYCEQNGLSPYMLFSAAFGLLLFKLSGQSDFLVGTPVSGRTSPQLWQVLGAFIHTLPLRLRPEPQLGISAYLEQVRQSVLQMIEHQDCSLEALQKLYQQAGGREGALYHVMFSYRPVSEEDFALHGAKMQYIPIDTATSKLDLSLEAAKIAGHFEFFLEYATALFDEASMQVFARSYCAALAELVGGEARSLAEVSALAAADRIALYEKPCRMRMPYLNQPLDVTVSQMAELLGEQPAVIFGGKAVSYAALERRACEIAGQLSAAGVQPGETIAFAHRRTPDLFAVMLGILKVGCAYLPMLSSFPESRLQYMLENAGARLIFCDGKSREELPDSLPCKIIVKDTIAGSYQPLAERGEGEIISVLYTSGSTGRPKGVPNYHRSMANLLANLERYLEGAGQTVLCTTGVVFDTFLTESLLPLCMGKRIVLADEEQMMLPWQIAALCRQQGADIMQFTPSRLQMCLGNDAFAQAVAGVKLVLLAGEALSPALLENLRSKTDARVINLYGPTEAAVYVTAADVTNARGRVTIGRPLYNCRAYVLDESMRRALPTAIGELYLAGACLSPGYVNREDLTNQAFLDDPFFPGEKMYKTGDLARLLPNGEIEYMGRRDSQVKLNGQRIELEEITGQMLGIAGVAEAATVAVRRQDGSMALRGFIVQKDGAIVEQGEIQRHLAAQLPQYMIPGELFVLEALPRTATGKTDVRALQDYQSAPAVQEEQQPPKADVRQRLAAIWQTVLERTEVDEEVSFFEQGGSSLAALHVLSQYFNQGWQMTLSQFYEAPTIAAQAKRLQEAVEGPAAAEPVQGTLFENTVQNPPAQQEAAATEANFVEVRPREIASGEKSILLTGGTGFLGAHLIRALLEKGERRLFCLVRGGDSARLKETLAWYFGSGWTDARFSAIQVVEGDVGQENFGLTEQNLHALGAQIRLVLHAAADIRHYADERESLAINCQGTAHVIDFTARFGAQLAHISTISVAGERLLTGPQHVIFTEEDFEIGQNWRDNVYVKGKFLAEKLVRDAGHVGLPVQIFRVGRLVGRSSDGVFQKNPAGNAFYAFLQGAQQLEALPERFAEMPVEMTPVDDCAAAIVALLGAQSGVYHVIHPGALTLYELMEQLRGPLPLLDDQAFERHLAQKLGAAQDASMAMLADVWARVKAQPFAIEPSAQRTEKALLEHGFAWKRIHVPVALAAFIK